MEAGLSGVEGTRATKMGGIVWSGGWGRRVWKGIAVVGEMGDDGGASTIISLVRAEGFYSCAGDRLVMRKLWRDWRQRMLNGSPKR